MFPVGAVAQTALGIGQAIGGAIRTHRAEKQLENLKSPTYNQSKSILDYYNQAMQRYNTNPYQSQQYQYAQQQADRSQAAGVNALQSRGSAVGGISRLSALRNDASLRAGVNAEQEQNQRFGQLGQAAELKTNEGDKAFQYNQLAPYQAKYNLLAMKAGGGAQTTNAGIKNAFGGLQNASDYQMLNQEYDLKDRNNRQYQQYLRAAAMGG